MLRTTLIALTATAGLAFAASSQAQAKTNINLDIGLNLAGGSGGIYVGGGDVYVDYGDDCHYVTVKHKKWNKWHTKKVVYYTKELVCY